MRKRDLLLGLGILGTFSMANAASPYTGVAIHTEGTQDLYLYQVESGKFLQNNQSENVTVDWTTRAQLYKYGFDWGVEALMATDADGNEFLKGYRLNPKFGANHSMNGGNHYLDTNGALTYWQFTPVTVDGVSNAYTIAAIEGDGVGEEPIPLGELDGILANDANVDGDTWQLVTRAERIEMAKQQVANGPVDMTWLVPGHDFANMDQRQNDNGGFRTRRWINNNGGNVAHGGDDGYRCNRVREVWHLVQNYQDFVVLEGLPNGTYRFRIQGWYRDGDAINAEEDADFWTRYDNGTSVKRAEYFANAAKGAVKLVTDEAFEGETPLEASFSYNEERDLYLPNSMATASKLFVDFPDAYQNEWIEAVVTDGTLVLGVQKNEGAHHDWFVYDNWELQYVSTSTDGAATELAAELTAKVEEAKTLPSTNGVKALIATAEEGLASGNAAVMRQALLGLTSSVASIKDASSIITNYNAVKALCHGFDYSEAESLFDAATDKAGFQEALNHLRNDRRRALAEKQTAEFKGAQATAGDFYIYNVGQKQFLQGGSDWGAHAALGFVGQLMTLETDEDAEADIAAGTFHINTHLANGEGKYYLNYRGYCDCAKAGKWLFTPVEGKENVYNISQADYEGVHWAWDPYASTDREGRDETNVGTEHRSVIDPENLDAQWMLVTPEERLALIEKASIDNPVDVSFLIQNPGFNQRASLDTWVFDGASVPNRGDCVSDFVVESWNSESTNITTTIEDENLPVGNFIFSVNAFYRYGNHAGCVDNGFPEEIELPYLIGGTNWDDAQPLRNILDKDFNNFCPGEFGSATNEAGETFYFPQWPREAAVAFRMGAYKTYMAVENDGQELFELGIAKDAKLVDEEWIVADNFRLVYYGPDASKDQLKAMAEELNSIDEIMINTPATAATDGRIYNLQGIQVANPTAPGIYISNGTKFVVK